MSVPILLLTFNRPATTQKVFDVIRKIKPKQLFVAQDGPRNKKEKILTDEVKKICNIDRECEVKYLTRDENLGCLKAVSEGIDRFFGHVEFGIILEDDCVPSLQIQGFCQKIDERYRNNKKVGGISLSNYQKSSRNVSGDILFTEHNPLLRGRATRRDRRQKYKEHSQVIKTLQVDKTGLSKKAIERYMKGGYRDSNRYAVSYANHRVNIVPPINLSANIGHIGIHNQRPGKYHDLEVRQYTNLQIPEDIHTSEDYDQEMLGFIKKMYIYTIIEKFLKKIGSYTIIHKSFITLHKILRGAK